MLWALYVDRDVLGPQPGQREVAQYAARAGWPAFEAMQRLVDMAWRRDRYAGALRARGKLAVDSAVEALEIMRALEPCNVPPQRLGEALAPVRGAGAAALRGEATFDGAQLGIRLFSVAPISAGVGATSPGGLERGDLLLRRALAPAMIAPACPCACPAAPRGRR